MEKDLNSLEKIVIIGMIIIIVTIISINIISNYL